jgi:hypothetical protein
MNNNIEMNFVEINTEAKTINSFQITAGSRNQKGFINSLNRKGFTPTKCGSEIIANSLDACSKNIEFRIKLIEKYIDLCDDGIGMTRETARYMFDANRENHSTDRSMGVSGIGGLISNYQLSKNDNGNPCQATIFTKNKNDTHLKITIPWHEIHEDKKYDDKIIIEDMNETEIDEFDADRKNSKYLTGTTIRFPYSETFSKLLDTQFVTQKDNSHNLEDWWAIIFGKTEANISLDKSNGLPIIPLKKYNYFSGYDDEFYCGKFIWDIYVILDKKENEDTKESEEMPKHKPRYISEDPGNPGRYIEIIPSGNGYASKPKPTHIDPREIEDAEIIKFTCGMRKDNRIFNPVDPLNKSAKSAKSATFYLNEYDSKFMKESGQKGQLMEFSSKTRVIRNTQSITAFPLEGCNSGSARANFDSLMKIALHRSEISYETFSKQENELDIIHGIQENKNQNQNDFPKQYVRLLSYLKEWHYKTICNYFKEVEEVAIKKEQDELERQLNKQKAKNDIKKAEKKRKRDEEEKRKRDEEEKRKRDEEEMRLLEQELLSKEKIPPTYEYYGNAKAEENDRKQTEIEAAAFKTLLQVEHELAEVLKEDETKINETTKDETTKDETKKDDSEEHDSEKDDTKTTDINNTNISDSKEWARKASQLIMQDISEDTYNKINGKELYDFVTQYINKK